MELNDNGAKTNMDICGPIHTIWLLGTKDMFCSVSDYMFIEASNQGAFLRTSVNTK